ncbi:MAG: DNA-packaging protein [Patescibacteria group bacterium]|nr:DNA-packaging protein [Patescibacteria group bacterium]
MIVAAEPIEPKMMRCISVDSPNRMYLAGRQMIPTHNTRVGAEWVNHRVEKCGARRIALVAQTAADARDVMVEGESGILAISPPWNRPKYEPSKRRLTWPNGAIATTFTAEEPDQLRGPQHDTGWLDEAGSYEDPAVISNFKLGLRLGKGYGVKPCAVVTTTPRPTKIIKTIIAALSTVISRGTTYENRVHLADEFIAEIEAMYEGTRLGRQEIHAELLEVLEGVWFLLFDPARHVTPLAEYDWHLPVYCAIDAGTSRHTAAVFFQHQDLGNHRCRINVFGDYYAQDRYSLENAEAIRETVKGFTIGQYTKDGRCDTVRLDPASGAKTGVGPAAYNEYERIFGPRFTSYWPQHRVLDGLDQIELLLGTPERGEPELLIHPRCTHLIAAFNGYDRKQLKGGDFETVPRDPNHPHEDLMDALRGGIREVFPSGRKIQPAFRRVKPKDFF